MGLNECLIYFKVLFLFGIWSNLILFIECWNNNVNIVWLYLCIGILIKLVIIIELNLKFFLKLFRELFFNIFKSNFIKIIILVK